MSYEEGCEVSDAPTTSHVWAQEGGRWVSGRMEAHEMSDGTWIWFLEEETPGPFGTFGIVGSLEEAKYSAEYILEKRKRDAG